MGKKQPTKQQKKAKSKKANAAHKKAKKLPPKKAEASKKPPAASTVGAPAVACPAPADPCKGLGLSSDQKARDFVKDFKTIQTDWPKLTEAQRRTRLADAANKALGKDFPPIRVKSEKTGGGAHYAFTDHALVVNEDLIKKGTLSDADAKTLAEHTYHESRHAEQWYMMARLLASQGKSKDEIAKTMKIPDTMAEKAHGDPLPKGGCAEQCAQKMYDSVYGANAAKRSQVLKDMKESVAKTNKAAEAFNNAQKKLDAVKNDPKATADQKKSAEDERNKKLKEYQDAAKDSDPKYKAYRDLPEEEDAWEQGGKTSKAWDAPEPAKAKASPAATPGSAKSPEPAKKGGGAA